LDEKWKAILITI